MSGIPENPDNPTNSFDRYLLLPPENRMHIIDRMRPADRIRYIRSSKLSHAEAERSVDYVYGLEYLGVDQDHARIRVLYEPFEYDDEDAVQARAEVEVEAKAESKIKDKDEIPCGFILEFKVESGVKIMKHINLQNKELYRSELSNSTDLIQYSVERFNKMLQKWQRIIEKLVIRQKWKFLREHKFQNFHSDIKCFSRLKELYVYFDADISQLLSKLGKPLKKFIYHGEIEYETLDKFEILKVSNVLILHEFEPTYAQFQQISAQSIFMRIGSISEKQIYKCIQAWKNGEIKKAFISYTWELEGSNFDTRKLLQLFGKEKDDSKKYLFIKHNFEENNRALLQFGPHDLNLGCGSAYSWVDAKEVY